MLTFYLLSISLNCPVVKIQHQSTCNWPKNSTTFVIPQSSFQIYQNRFLTSNQHAPTNLVKFIENNSNLGVKKSPRRFWARCSFEGLTGLTLGAQTIPILGLCTLAHGQQPNHAHTPKIWTLSLTQTLSTSLNSWWTFDVLNHSQFIEDWSNYKLDFKAIFKWVLEALNLPSRPPKLWQNLQFFPKICNTGLIWCWGGEILGFLSWVEMKIGAFGGLGGCVWWEMRGGGRLSRG